MEDNREHTEELEHIIPDAGRAAAVDAAVVPRIRDLWRCLKTKDDLLRLVNVALEGLYGENSSRVTMSQLNRYSYSSIESKRYTTFRIPKKKKGEYRTIDAPVPMLKYIQRGLNLVFQSVFIPHTAAMGFVPHKSVVDNARVHIHLLRACVQPPDSKAFLLKQGGGQHHHRPLLLQECRGQECVAAGRSHLADDNQYDMRADGQETHPAGEGLRSEIHQVCRRHHFQRNGRCVLRGRWLHQVHAAYHCGRGAFRNQRGEGAPLPPGNAAGGDGIEREREEQCVEAVCQAAPHAHPQLGDEWIRGGAEGAREALCGDNTKARRPPY